MARTTISDKWTVDTDDKFFKYKLVECILTFIHKENRIYIRGDFGESLGMNFLSLFQPEREFKVYKSCKCSQIVCS